LEESYEMLATTILMHTHERFWHMRFSSLLDCYAKVETCKGTTKGITFTIALSTHVSTSHKDVRP